VNPVPVSRRQIRRVGWGSRVFNPAAVLITPKGQET
jgi:hypothetical protein